LETLRGMNAAHSEARLCFWRFQIHMLGLLGFAPNFQLCQKCGATNVAANASNALSMLHFDVAHGGVLCERCSSMRNAQLLSTEAVRLLTSLQTVAIDKLARFKISPPTRHAIEHFFRTYYAYHLEEVGNLSSLKFVRAIKAPGSPPPK